MPLPPIEDDDMSDGPETAKRPAKQGKPAEEKPAQEQKPTKGEKHETTERPKVLPMKKESAPRPKSSSSKAAPKAKVLKRPAKSVDPNPAPTAKTAPAPVSKKPATQSQKTERAYKYAYHNLDKYGIKYKGHELLTAWPSSFCFKGSVLFE